MDSYHPPSPYMRPPQPPPDPYQQYYQHPARPPVPPPPQPHGASAWYPNNQYHHPLSPSPPPPRPPQWGPPPPEHLPSQPHSSPAYPPPPPSFPAHPHQPPFGAGANSSGHFRLPHPPPMPSTYPQVNQEWGNHNWGYHQGHASQANNNAEDWAVKAREWAASKAAAEVQHPQSASNPPSGTGDQVPQQYPDHGHQDGHRPSVPGLSYQQFPVPPATQPDGYPNYPAVDGSLPGGSFTGFSHQENLPTSSAIHQQEVPSSYSSVAEESSNTTLSEAQISVPGAVGPVSADQPYFYGDQTAAPPSSLNDQPLQFTPRASYDYANPHSVWPPPSSTGIVYPPIPSSLPSAPQHDPSMVVPPASGHAMPPFGRFPPPNFQSTVQSAGPSYAFGTKPPLHPAAGFIDDTYAASAVCERPKKAPVPAWLKEEILKNKAALGKSSSGNHVGRESMDDDFLEKPLRKPDQPDAKSLSSSKSTDDEEEEEEDEDDVEAARTAAINQEIKRILTEVLLKVTDELFDEIATKIISEDDMKTEDGNIRHDHKSSSLSPPIAAEQMQQASSEIQLLPKDKKIETEGASRRVSSVSPGAVLGLVTYASDDDDDDGDNDDDGDGCADANGKADADGIGGVQSSSVNVISSDLQQSSTKKFPESSVGSNARSELEIQSSEIFSKNSKSSVDEYSDKCGSRGSDYKADVDSSKVVDRGSGSGLSDDTSGGSKEHTEGTDSHKDTAKNARVRSDGSRKGLREEVSRERDRLDDKETRKEMADHRNGSRDRTKQKDVKLADKDKGSESNKKSTIHHDAKKDSRDGERPRRTNSKEDGDRKRERVKEEDRSRHKKDGDTGKDRRKRSSPTSDETSDDSRRMSRSRRRNLSPSPVRSRRRNVSRSPLSKHSQSRHSPYSSRGRRSRSRSPHRRHRV